jgi:predicted permease
MRSLDLLRLRLRSLFLRGQVEKELHAELAFHLEQQTAEFVAAGMTPVEARHAAHRVLGNVGKIEEDCRDMRRTRWIETFLQDLRYALRSLRLSPAFTIVATLSLALGIGANTAIFSLMDALLLRSLPVKAPERLAVVGDPIRVNSLSEGTIRSDHFSVLMYRELRDKNQVFSGLAGSGRVGRLVVGAERSAKEERVRGRLVTGNYFEVLGVPAWRGRVFTAEDDRSPGAAPYVVISFDYWQRRFAGDPGVIGRKITLNDYPFTIVGVAPPEFFGEIVGSATDLWIPVSMQPQVNPGRNFLDRWDISFLVLMGRLQPGVSLDQARGSIVPLFSQIVATHVGGAIDEGLLPDDLSQMSPVEVTSGETGLSALRSQFSRPLSTLMVIVALVLLIACANVANLLLERASGRQKEISVRLALGAGRGRLVRQLLTESLLLAALGGAVGVLFAYWADAGLLKMMIGVSRSAALDLRPNLRVLAFTAAVAALTGILFGLVPALRATRVELAPALKESSRGLAGRRRWPLGKLLVVSQFAVSLLLLMSAGLFMRTLVNLQRLDLGFPRDGLVLLELDPVAAGYEGERLRTLVDQLLERLRAVPGVSGVTLSENGIFSGTESSTSIAISGRPELRDPDDDVNYDHVGPDYFKVVGIPIVVGRDIGPQDRKGAPRVAVINETMARFYFPGQNPLGQRFAETNEPDVIYEIVGVSGDARDHDLRGPVTRRYYAPLMQSENLSTFNFEIRTPEPKTVLAPIREAVRGFDPRLVIQDIAPLNVNIDESIGDERLVAKLSAVFGVLALLLASIGLYGVVSYTVSRRINEIGIRMALGANHGKVLWMVLRETLLLALAGIVLGLLAVFAAARVVSSRLYGLSAYDPPTLAAATAVLVAVAILAGAIPGSKATRVDPTEALRYE